MKKYFAIFAGIFLVGFLVGFLTKSYTSISLQTIKPTPTASVKIIQSSLPKKSTEPKITFQVLVTKVLDGDTFVIEGGEHVRMLGIDADEKDYPCYDPARLRLEQLILNKRVSLERDVTDRDQYGRLLRYVSTDTNIGSVLLQEGLAIARFYSPNTKYSASMTTSEHTAIKNHIGCKWSGI